MTSILYRFTDISRVCEFRSKRSERLVATTAAHTQTNEHFSLSLCKSKSLTSLTHSIITSLLQVLNMSPRTAIDPE